jgi:hypothetical protein
MIRRLLLCSALTASLWAALSAPGANALSRSSTTDFLLAERTPQDLLRDVARFTEADWTALQRGEAVAKVLDTDAREVAVAGAVRIAGSRERLVDRYRQVESLKRSAVVLDVGRFGPVPRAADLASAPLEEYGLDVRKCRPGDCHVRLSAADIARFQREVNWRSPGWRTESAAVWREVLAAHAAAYAATGRKGLPEYVNKAEPLQVANELSLLLRAFTFVADYSPELYQYLLELGREAPPGVEQMLYWTKEDFGLHPILRLSHQVIYRTSSQVPATIIAVNQIYADHYLDAAVSLTLAVDASDARGEAFYMIAVNRARTRSLTGLLRRMVRATVQSRSRDSLRNILLTSKAGIERARNAAGLVVSLGIHE